MQHSEHGESLKSRISELNIILLHPIGLQMRIHFQFIGYLLVNMYIVACATVFLLIVIAIVRKIVDSQKHLTLEHVVFKFTW